MFVVRAVLAGVTTAPQLPSIFGCLRRHPPHRRSSSRGTVHRRRKKYHPSSIINVFEATTSERSSSR
jgi:hypothetical protein